MDSQKFYECEKNNMYNVHFPNKLGWSVDVIKEIFSEFGDVVLVSKAGDDYGFRFVKYRTEEEAQRCVEGLKNHKTIRLLPKKPKQNNDQRNEQRNNNWTNKRDSPESKGNWASWEQKKPEDGEKFRRNNDRKTDGHREYTNRRSDDAAPTKRDAESHKEKPQQTSENVRSLNEDKLENAPDSRENHQERVNNREEAARVDADEVGPVDSPIQPCVPAEANKVCDPAAPPTTRPFATMTTLRSPLLQTVTEEAASALADVAAGNKRDSPIETPMPTTSFISPEITAVDIPKLVQKRSKVEKPSETKNPTIVAEIKQLTIEAEAVVVANVHTDYGVHYILHLFQKHDPICVSPMKIILKQGLRYCIVYVQSPLQARNIEEKFDNYSLCGKELIVLRAEKLAQIANEL